MATVITQECINCGACEPECPNTAIYQAGVEYDWQGKKHTAISEDFFYIVPEKCTECVGFYDYEACAAVCPVDCCVPDPDRPEAEDALIARAKVLHPDKDFGERFPSRFNPTGEAPKKDGGTDAAAATPAAAPAAPAAGPAVATAVATAVAMPAADAGEIDVPITCRSCSGEYAVAFRFLSPGVYLRCPHCGAPFCPTQRTYLAISERLERYTDAINTEIDRHNAVVVAEQESFEENAAGIRAGVEQDVRSIVREMTEPPKKSMFG